MVGRKACPPPPSCILTSAKSRSLPEAALRQIADGLRRHMPVGGALVLKGVELKSALAAEALSVSLHVRHLKPVVQPCTGGQVLGDINKKKKKRKVKQPAQLDDEAADGAQAAQDENPSTALRTVTTTSGKAAKPGAVSILTGMHRAACSPLWKGSSEASACL